MEYLYVYRNEQGEITGSSNISENGEKILANDPEYISWLNKPHLLSWNQIRLHRKNLLIESDWTVSNDATPKPSKEAWLTYRQTLRDIPQTFSTPEEVVWPEKPE